MKYIRALYSLLLLAAIGLIVVGIWRQQPIRDWLALRGYTPPTTIAKLADETTMLPDTRRIFYVNHPQLDEKVTFNGDCRTTEQSIVLGCYVGNKGIFLLNVTDPRLSGVIEVTAAHETLHAEYDRLSSKERARVDAMTASFFATLTDERIKQTVESYRSKDPSVVPNELHSILGTEVEDLPPQLETYYAQYFKDRKAIVRYSQQYEQAFVDLRSQVDSYDKQLERLKAAIDANQAAIDSQSAELENDRRNLDSLRGSGDTAAYNAAVPGFNQKVNAYNSLIQKTKAQIEQYNALIEKRNAVAVQEQELTQALDSNFTTQAQQ
jgi:uncharacterized protein YukE